MLKSFLSNVVAKHMSKKLSNLTIKEEDVAELLKEIRITLLNADVSLIVVKDLIKNIRNKTVGQVITEKMDAQQFMLNVIKEELVEILGKEFKRINFDAPLDKIMLVGLNGTGKTTTAAKLALYAKNKLNKKPLLVALDIYRPAAIDQLKTLAQEIDVECFSENLQNAAKIAEHAIEYAKQNKFNLLIFDTAGRLQTDENLMSELEAIKKTTHPEEILMIVDSMSGQDMINVATEFNNRLNLTGFIITKLDSDARAGVALSLTHLLNVPIKMTGTGEKVGSLDLFYPERMADRIMGLGDIMTLAEKAKDVIDESSMKKSLTRMLAGKMSFEDLLIQTKQMQKLGSLSSIIKMIPNAEKLASNSSVEEAEEKIRIWTILMNSMTAQERKDPSLFKRFPSRKERVLKGSGRKPEEFNKLYTSWEKYKKQMESFGNELKKGKNPFAKFM